MLEVVRSTFEHPTAEWIHKNARKRLPNVGLATVYRNLKSLAGRGLVREVHSSDEAVRYDGNTGEHYHIRCLSCGRVSDLPGSVNRGIEVRARTATKYAILGHTVEVQGVCPHCQHHSLSRENQSQADPSLGQRTRSRSR